MSVAVDKGLKYKELAGKMEQDILSGRLAPGQPVPSIRMLMASGKLSKGTVMKSLELLEGRGLVARHPQRGFFVTDRNRPDPKMLQIAFLTPSLTGDTLPCVKGINQAISSHDHITLASYSTQADLPRYKQLLERIVGLRPAGVILTAIEKDLVQINLRPLAESGIPVVILGDTMEGILCDRVFQRGGELVRQAIQHLLSRGGRRFALMLGQPMKHPGQEGIIETARRELASAGLSLPDEQIIFFDTPHGYAVPADPYVDAREKMREVLVRGTKFDCVVTLCDYYAVGALQALKEAGVRVPQDVKVASITRNAIEGATTIKLTTIDTRPEERARVAAGLLLRRIEGYTGPVEVHHVAGELMTGETT